EELGRALTVRGAVRAAAARAAGPVPDLPGLARAEADLYRAVGLLELLAGRFPGLHEPRGLLGDAWAALVPLADDRAAVGTLLGVPGDPWAGVGAAAVNRENLLTRVQKAAASYRKAAARCRECPHYPRRAEELRRDWPAAAEWVEGQRQARMADRE
ncbi:MAG: hypothetical protein K2X87_08560, partial [Gemmataceae bacterium]|nr:hypothetical protein [Gemmataceae bacterium]